MDKNNLTITVDIMYNKSVNKYWRVDFCIRENVVPIIDMFYVKNTAIITGKLYNAYLFDKKFYGEI